jgi:hypothetical protein
MHTAQAETIARAGSSLPSELGKGLAPVWAASKHDVVSHLNRETSSHLSQGSAGCCTNDISAVSADYPSMWQQHFQPQQHPPHSSQALPPHSPSAFDSEFDDAGRIQRVASLKSAGAQPSLPPMPPHSPLSSQSPSGGRHKEEGDPFSHVQSTRRVATHHRTSSDGSGPPFLISSSFRFPSSGAPNSQEHEGEEEEEEGGEEPEETEENRGKVLSSSRCRVRGGGSATSGRHVLRSGPADAPAAPATQGAVGITQVSSDPAKSSQQLQGAHSPMVAEGCKSMGRARDTPVCNQCAAGACDTPAGPGVGDGEGWSGGAEDMQQSTGYRSKTGGGGSVRCYGRAGYYSGGSEKKTPGMYTCSVLLVCWTNVSLYKYRAQSGSKAQRRGQWNGHVSL